jgi:hypothetical protein
MRDVGSDDQGLREKMIPQMKREVAIRGTKTRDGVVLEGLDSAFRRVPAVDMRRCELEVNFLLCHELLQGGGGFVVEALEDGLRPREERRAWTLEYAAKMEAPDLLGMGTTCIK